MAKLSKNREKYLLEKHFKHVNTRSKKDLPLHLEQLGCRDCDTADEDLYFVSRYVKRVDRLILGGSLVTRNGLSYLKAFEQVKYLDLRSMPLDNSNLDNIIHLKDLEYLYIKFTSVRADGISEILKSFPKLQTLIAEVALSESGQIERWRTQYPDVDLSISETNDDN